MTLAPSSFAVPSQRLTPSVVTKLLSEIDYILLDIDGVLWSGDHVFDGVPETLQWLRGLGKKIRFLSNNSTMSRETTAKKFAKKGIDGVTCNEVYTSGYAAALHLKHLSGSAPRLLDTNVFVVGEQGLHDEIRRVLAPGRITYGMELTGIPYEPTVLVNALNKKILPPPSMRAPSAACTSIAELDCGVVVVGLDLHFSMVKLACAGLCFQQPISDTKVALRYVATNEDPQFPVGSEGLLMPGAGCVVNAVSTVAGRQPDVVCGKPFPHMAKILFENEGIADPRRCLMIGDRLSTDIAFGNGAGCQSMMVLTGCETVADVEAEVRRGRTQYIPHFIADSLASLMHVGKMTAKL